MATPPPVLIHPPISCIISGSIGLNRSSLNPNTEVLRKMRLLYRSFIPLALVLLSFGLAGAQGTFFTVQIKASPSRAEADEEVRQLKAQNISAYVVKSDVPGKGVFYRVRAGVFSSRNDANKYGANLQQRGVISEFFVTVYEKADDEVASRPAPTGPPPAKARPNQPAPNSPSGEAPAPVRPATQKRPDSANLNNAPGEAPAPVRPATQKRPDSANLNNPPGDAPSPD